MAQGFPSTDRVFAKVLEETQPARLHDLAGNALTSTVVYSVFAAMLLSSPWSGEGGIRAPSSSDDASAAVIAFLQSTQEPSETSE